MSEDGLIKMNGIVWYITARHPDKMTPLCPTHNLTLRAYPPGYNDYSTYKLECAECDEPFSLPRKIWEEKKYVIDKLNSKIFKKMKILNLDDEAIPIAETKISSEDSKYFVTALLTESKVGKRLVIYAGEKGGKEKTQIFIEPDIKRLAFDQKDKHPSEVFLKLEATFKDGSKSSVEAKQNDTTQTSETQ